MSKTTDAVIDQRNRTALVSKEMKLKDITINGNVRTTTDGALDKELVESVKQTGILEPLLVRKKEGKYVLIAGHRRLAAAKEAGCELVPTRILDVNDTEATEIQIIENLQRRNLTPLEEAEAYVHLADQGQKQPIWNHVGVKQLPEAIFKQRVALVAKAVGKPIRYVTQVLRLVELPKQVKVWIKQGKLTAVHGAMLVDLTDKGRDRIVKDYISGQVLNLQPGDVFPVSDLKRKIDTMFFKNLAMAPFPTDIEFGGVLACTACPQNSGNAMELFGKGGLGNCRDTACWNSKKDQVYRNLRTALEKKAPFSEKKLKFIGFSRMESEGQYGGGRITMPKVIRGLPVIEWNDKNEKLALASPDKYGWAIVKPTADRKNPRIEVVLIVKDADLIAKLPGKKIKIVPATDYKRERTISDAIEEAVLVKIGEAVSKLKPSEDFFRLLADRDFVSDVDPWQEAAKQCNMTIRRKDIETMPIKQLGMLWFSAIALSNDDGAKLLDVDTKPIEKEVTATVGKKYDDAKAKAQETAKQ